jgi:hypothetical protein
MQCEKCTYYKPGGIFTKPACTRIANYNVISKKSKPMKLETSKNICKGYFFEHKDSDLYHTKDASLSSENDPFWLIWLNDI